MSLDHTDSLDQIKRNHYAECFLHNNASASTITTASTQHAISGYGAGHSEGISPTAGITGTTSAFADYSGTVAGTVKATDTAHGLTTGDIITIEGGANYAGVHQITVIDANEFYFTDIWVSDDGAQPWTRGDYIEIKRKGTYILAFSASITPASANQVFEFHIYKGTTELDHFKVEHKFLLTSDIATVSMTGVDPADIGDRFWISMANITSAANLTIKNSNMSIIQV